MTTTVANLDDPTEVHQPAHPHLTATLVLGCMAQFMVILDVSVVNVALPAIKHALGFSEAGLQWVVNAYTVTFAGFLLLGGRAADLLGRRRVFCSGLVLFALSSLVGGFSHSGTMLVTARLVQGVGGAVIGPASLSILTTTFTEPRARNRAIGAWGAMGGVGGAAGVILGGVLVDLLSWRWILFVNVPIGLIGALAARELLLEGRNQNATRNFDFTGAVLATGGLSAIVFGIVHTEIDGWGSPVTLIPMIAGLALVGMFLIREGRFAKAPLLPLRLFHSRSLSAANVVVMTVGGSTFAMWFFTTLYMQDVWHYSPLKTGVAYLPLMVALVTSSTIATKLVSRTGPKRLLITGMLFLTVGLALFSRMTVGGSYLMDMLIPGVITCIGMPLGIIPGTLCATADVAPHEAGIASGVANTARLFGGALGLAILATLATSHSDSLLAHHAATVSHALVSGFRDGLVGASIVAFLGALVAVFGMPPINARNRQPAAEPVPET